jgi:hypothetical protein
VELGEEADGIEWVALGLLVHQLRERHRLARVALVQHVTDHPVHILQIQRLRAVGGEQAHKLAVLASMYLKADVVVTDALIADLIEKQPQGMRCTGHFVVAVPAHHKQRR